MKSDDCQYFIGVDGGGTRCRVRLRKADGSELAYCEGGSANVHTDPEGALATIRSAVDRAIQSAGAVSVDPSKTAIGLGLAGIVSLADSGRVQASLAGYAHVMAASDAAAACIGAHYGADGGLVIAGTGSAGLAYLNGKMTAIGGRGFAISDEGSAARIGWEALRQSLWAADDLGPPSKMTVRLWRIGSDCLWKCREGRRRGATYYQTSDAGYLKPPRCPSPFRVRARLPRWRAFRAP